MVRNFKPASEIHEREIRKMFGHFEHHFEACKKNTYVLNIASGMHVNSFYLQAGRFYNTLDMTHLVHTDTELTIDMTSRHFIMPASHDMRIETNTNGVRATELI